ncbi:MAG: hypothetical protein M8350_08565 [Methanosarcinaceae archaeon]|nr:hypothetical protein [Methanosarcinaceae archaeon]
MTAVADGNESASLVNGSTNHTNSTINCTNCHNEQITPASLNTEKCNKCHRRAHGYEDGEPSRYSDKGKITIHKMHSRARGNDKQCLECHATPSCDNCHNSHESILDINVSNNCQNCHGRLPDPIGHKKIKTAFEDSMHSWMNSCDTCHYKNKLHFKDLAEFEIDESKNLCYVCHSKQSNNESHTSSIVDLQQCVDCHNPHGQTTKSFEINFDRTNRIIDSAMKYVTDNPIITIIIFLLVGSVVSEYAFAPDKGKIILAKTLRVEHDKRKTKAIRIEWNSAPLTIAHFEEEGLIYSSNLTLINEIMVLLDAQRIELLGMVTSEKEIILFVSDAPKGIIEEINTMHGVENVEFSNNYEV